MIENYWSMTHKIKLLNLKESTLTLEIHSDTLTVKGHFLHWKLGFLYFKCFESLGQYLEVNVAEFFTFIQALSNLKSLKFDHNTGIKYDHKQLHRVWFTWIWWHAICMVGADIFWNCHSEMSV